MRLGYDRCPKGSVRCLEGWTKSTNRPCCGSCFVGGNYAAIRELISTVIVASICLAAATSGSISVVASGRQWCGGRLLDGTRPQQCGRIGLPRTTSMPADRLLQ